MPNPKANQQPLDLDRIKADAMSMGIPARALLDMIYSGGRSAIATTAGLPADLANTAIGVHNMARDIRRNKFEGYEPGTIPGGSEDIKGLIPDLTKDPNSNLNKMADFGGDFAVIPGAGTAAVKGAKMIGQEIADRVATGRPLMHGAFNEPQMAMHVVQPSKLVSAVDKTAAELPRAKGTGKEFMTELTKKPGVKKAELADRNLHEINDLPKMTKEQFQAELEKRPKPEITKKILGKHPDTEQYYTVPEDDEGMSDRHYVMDANHEQVTRHPFDTLADAEEHIRKLENASSNVHHMDWKLPGGENYQEHLYKYEPEGQEPFVARKEHFGAEPNVLASARTVDRRTPEGKKILHVEEIQSDWHQRGRDEGYQRKDLTPEEIDLKYIPPQVPEGHDPSNYPGYYEAFDKNTGDFVGRHSGELTHDQAMRDAVASANQFKTGVPQAPFKKNWEEMVSKDLVKHAIDNGYDAIALTPGAEQADRYNLSKHVDSVTVSPTGNGNYRIDAQIKGGGTKTETNLDANGVEAMIGKELASKLIPAADARLKSTANMREVATNGDDAEYNRLRESRKDLPPTTLSGLDLKIGGEGMKSAYDNRLPNIFNDIGKPHGAEMKLNELPILNSGKHYSKENLFGGFNVMNDENNSVSYHPTLEEANIKAKELNSTPLHYMEFTPEMKQNIRTDSLPAYADGGQVEHPGFLNPSLKLANGQVTLDPLEFMPNYLKGGKVHVADDLDMMRHEIHMSEGGVMTDAVLKKMGDFIKKSSKESFLPLNLKRAKSPNDQEMMKIAEPVIRQMTGEHVVPEGSTKKVNLAGRSMKESQRLKDLPYSLTTKEPTGKPDIYTPKIGDVNIAFPGDQTISDSILHSVGDIEGIDSEQEGGAKYGLGKLHLELPKFWASGEDPAQSAQDKITRLAGYYDPDRVIAQHLAMGPTSNNFAMHLADANLRATDFSKMTPEQMYSFDNIIANGFVKKNAKTGEYEHFNFPHWPGIADPEGAYKAMQKDSELRKWYNSRMKTPEITSAHGLPNGLDIQWAITEPSLRNMQINMTGLSAGEVVPGAELTDTADHNTYEKGIRGLALQPITPPKPVQITFPDATQHILDTKRAQDFTGTLQKVFPHQVVDDQYLNDVGRYDALIKKYTGQKKGGRIKAKKAKVHVFNDPDMMRHELKTRG